MHRHNNYCIRHYNIYFVKNYKFWFFATVWCTNVSITDLLQSIYRCDIIIELWMVRLLTTVNRRPMTSQHDNTTNNMRTRIIISLTNHCDWKANNLIAGRRTNLNLIYNMLSVRNSRASAWVIYRTLNILPAPRLVSTQLLSLFRRHWWSPICQLDNIIIVFPKKIYDALSAASCTSHDREK